MFLVDDHQRKKSLLNVTLTLALVVFPIPNLEAKYTHKVRYYCSQNKPYDITVSVQLCTSSPN